MQRRSILQSGLRLLFAALGIVALTATAPAQPAAEPAKQSFAPTVPPFTPAQRATHEAVNQTWTSDFGYSIMLPSVAKYNKIGSLSNRAGGTEKANFMIPGGNGSITLTFFTEPRQVPKDFRTIDSLHYYQYDSTGRNGIIHRRVYVMREHAVHVDVLLTEKGEQAFGAMVPAIFDSFTPAPGTIFALEGWRYGRDPREYQQGRYGQGTGPGHDGR